MPRGSSLRWWCFASWCLFFLLSVYSNSTSSRIGDFNVVWSDLLPEPGVNSEGILTYRNAMPIGNGDLTALIFVDETNGTLSFLLSSSDAWSEAGELVKLALVRVSFDPNPFSLGSYFHQELVLSDGLISLTFGGNSGLISARIRVDAALNVLVAELSLESAGVLWTVETDVESVRPVETQTQFPFECLTYATSADVLLNGGNALFLYHRNGDTAYVRKTLQQLNLDACVERAPDPITNRTFGVMTELYVTPWTQPLRADHDGRLRAQMSSGTMALGVWALSQQTASVSEWLQSIERLAQSGLPPLQAHLDWWSAFNNRSHLFVSAESASTEVTRLSQQYALVRFLHAIQSRGAYPIRFNGQQFTANRAPYMDSRDWGSKNWWQNVRLPYYSMLAAGDAEQIQASLIGFFAGTMPFALCQTQAYYGFRDAAVWSEYTGPFGATHTQSYGCADVRQPDWPNWYADDPWNHYNQQQSLDLSTFVLDHFQYTEDLELLQANLPIVLAALEFFRLRWGNSSASSEDIVVYPTQSLETWQCPNYPWSTADCATNDLPTIAGLRFVLPRVLSLPSGLVPLDTQAALRTFLERIPPLPTVNDTDGERLVPCDRCPPSTSNSENTELYAVHPFRLLTAAKSTPSELSVAQRTYDHIRFPSDDGWGQVGMDVALLALVTETANLLLARAAMEPAPGYRFPAFMPHLQDYEPSADHLANLANALHYALAQTVDDADGRVVLFPAWPCEWDVDFKIHVPKRTVVSGSLQGGQLKMLEVDPPSRKLFVEVRECTKSN